MTTPTEQDAAAAILAAKTTHIVDPEFVDSLLVITANAPRTYERTSWLRWHVVQYTLLSGPAILQQAWCCRETGEIEWRDVEVVQQPLPEGKA